MERKKRRFSENFVAVIQFVIALSFAIVTFFVMRRLPGSTPYKILLAVWIICAVVTGARLAMQIARHAEREKRLHKKETLSENKRENIHDNAEHDFPHENPKQSRERQFGEKDEW